MMRSRTISEKLLSTKRVENFSVALSEAARADETGAGRFIEPADGTLKRALSNRHHLVFGRRGSGKTSLLQKARAELVAERRPNAFIDMEKFKAHSYPDVLISVLIETFECVGGWLVEGAIAPANKKSFWKRIVPRKKPLARRESDELAAVLNDYVAELNGLLYVEDGAQIEMLNRGQVNTTKETVSKSGLSKGPAQLSHDRSSSSSSTETDEFKESTRRSKTDFLHRRVLEYQTTLRKIVALAGANGFVMLDDLYYIKKAHQPDVLDYFHRMFKGSGLWLKVGTIRHRSEWYRHGDPTTGMKLGDDVDDIDLDLTLEKYSTAKDFLQTGFPDDRSGEGQTIVAGDCDGRLENWRVGRDSVGCDIAY